MLLNDQNIAGGEPLSQNNNWKMMEIAIAAGKRDRASGDFKDNTIQIPIPLYR
jgi:hypothetical protein